MTGTEVQKFQPIDLREVISSKIKAQFVELIPDEAWTQMVEAEIKKLTEPVLDRYGTVKEMAPLQAMIYLELKAIATEQIKEALSSEQWRSRWLNGDQMASEAVTKIVQENAHKMVTQVFSSTVQCAVQNAVNNMRTY